MIQREATSAETEQVGRDKKAVVDSRIQNAQRGFGAKVTLTANKLNQSNALQRSYYVIHLRVLFLRKVKTSRLFSCHLLSIFCRDISAGLRVIVAPQQRYGTRLVDPASSISSPGEMRHRSLPATQSSDHHRLIISRSSQPPVFRFSSLIIPITSLPSFSASNVSNLLCFILHFRALIFSSAILAIPCRAPATSFIVASSASPSARE